jgi:hypothetical protein
MDIDKIVQLLLDREIVIKDLNNLFEKYPELRPLYETMKLKQQAEKYVKGKLKNMDKFLFEAKLMLNKELQQHVELQKKLIVANKNLDLYLALKKAHKEYVSEVNLAVSKLKQLRHKIILNTWRNVAAASIIVLFAATFSIRIMNQDASDLYNKYYSPITEQATFSEGTPLDLAKTKYLNSNYSDALISFQNLPKTINIQSEKSFFTGLTLMELERFDDAVIEFRNVLKMGNFENQSNSLWYLGLSYLKNQEMEMAVNTFKKVVEIKGYKYKEASKLLKKIK